MRTINKKEFLTDCKELFVTYSIHVLDNVIVLFAKMSAFIITTNVCVRVQFHYGRTFLKLEQVQVSLVQ